MSPAICPTRTARTAFAPRRSFAALDRDRRGRHGTQPEVLLYRGAWQEWAPHEIEIAVPLSPSDLDRKKAAIFRHESQKDSALFPGPDDSRESSGNGPKTATGTRPTSTTSSGCPSISRWKASCVGREGQSDAGRHPRIDQSALGGRCRSASRGRRAIGNAGRKSTVRRRGSGEVRERYRRVGSRSVHQCA